MQHQQALETVTVYLIPSEEQLRARRAAMRSYRLNVTGIVVFGAGVVFNVTTLVLIGLKIAQGIPAETVVTTSWSTLLILPGLASCITRALKLKRQMSDQPESTRQ